MAIRRWPRSIRCCTAETPPDQLLAPTLVSDSSARLTGSISTTGRATSCSRRYCSGVSREVTIIRPARPTRVSSCAHWRKSSFSGRQLTATWLPFSAAAGRMPRSISRLFGLSRASKTSSMCLLASGTALAPRGRYCSSCRTRSTRSRVAGATSGRPLSTLEMVGVETPARCATCCSVRRLDPRLTRSLSSGTTGIRHSKTNRNCCEMWPWRWPPDGGRPALTLVRVKFTDGYWQLRRGVQARYPAEAYDVAAEPEALTVYAPTRRITTRGDTLNEPMVTVRCTSPAPEVIAVEITHFAGGRPRFPQFALESDPAVTVRTDVDDHQASLTSGALTARFIREGRFGLEFLAGGRVLTASLGKAMALVSTDADGPFVREQLSLDVGEYVYGLGERFGPLVKNGQVVDIWNADGGTATEQAYKNVPFYLTDAGYGVFVDHPGRVSFEVGSEVVTRVSFSVPGQSLRYLVIYGPTPRDIL